MNIMFNISKTNTHIDKTMFNTMPFIAGIFIVFSAMFISFSAVAQSKSTLGNRYLTQEKKTTHTVQFTLGYNKIQNNDWSLYGKGLVGLPIGLSYEFTKNNFWYGKVKYTNYSMKSVQRSGIIYDNSEYVGLPYKDDGSVSHHLISLSGGFAHYPNYNNRFSAGAMLGVMLEMEDDIREIYVQDDIVTDYISYSDKEHYGIVLGVDVAYQHYLTDNIFVGVEGNCGYIFISRDFCYSIGATIGYTFKHKKNFRF